MSQNRIGKQVNELLKDLITFCYKWDTDHYEIIASVQLISKPRQGPRVFRSVWTVISERRVA